MSPADTAAFHGIYPSTLCPFKPDYTIDEPTLAAHISAVAAVPGIVGILCNGHAGENFLLSRAEQKRVIEVTRDALGRKGILVAGVNHESSLEAAILAQDASEAGADAIMVFAPYSWALSQDPAMAINHHRKIVEAADLPIMLFQGSVRAGQTAFSPAVLEQLVQLPSVVAIKEGSWETSAYEANRRLIKAVAPHVAVMASGDEHLLSCYVLGSEGSLVSLAVIIPEEIVGLDRAVRNGDLALARKLHDVVYPLAKAIYGTPPGGHATARLKACLKLLGRLNCDFVRPPIGPLHADEVAMLQHALREAGRL
jgi:4-hydroxy-tetrahydrodipicolinate synthase